MPVTSLTNQEHHREEDSMSENETQNSLNIPILDGTNYTIWSSRMKIILRAKNIFDACITNLTNLSSIEETSKYNEISDKAIAIIMSGIKENCYDEVINSDTIDDVALLCQKISEQYALCDKPQTTVGTWSRNIYLRKRPILIRISSTLVKLLCQAPIFMS